MQGPRLYRFFNYELPLYLPAPMGGWNADAQPWEVPVTESPQLDNFLIRPGKLVMRGGFYVVAAPASDPIDVAGAMVNGNVLIARRNSSGGAVDPWNAPLYGTSSAALASGQTTMYYVDPTGAVTSVTGTADQVIGPRWINFDGLLYGLSYDSAGSVVQDVGQSYYMKPTSLLTLSKSLATLQQGPKCPGFVTQQSFVGSTVAWGAVGGTTTCGSPGQQQTSYGTGDVTNYLEYSDFAFSIPSTATITGINVELTKASQLGFSKDAHMYIMKAGAVQTAVDKADLSTQWPANPGQLTKDYGGSSDLWGQTWTPADINNSGFGFAFAAQYAGPGTPEAAAVYSTVVTVYYTIAISSPHPLPTVLSSAPHGAIDVKGHQSRLWLLGGIDTPAAGTHHSSTTLFFSNEVVAGGGSASADWQDPISGLTNQIKMDNNSQDPGVALATVKGGLLILRRSSVWFLKGTSEQNYSIAPISLETGCVDARSVVESDSGVYFMSSKGLMLTDGAHIQNVSGGIMYTLQDAVAYEQTQVAAGTGGYISCGLTSRGQVIVSIGLRAGAGGISPVFCAMYDPSATKGGAWVRITSSVWANDGSQQGSNNYPGVVIWQQAPHQVYTIGDQYVTRLEDLTVNYSFLTSKNLYDQGPGSPGSARYVSIPAYWRTPIPGITTSAKRVQAIAHRYYLDYNFAAQGYLPTNAWQMQAVDPHGNVLSTSIATAGAAPMTAGFVSGITPVPNTTILRLNTDFFNEVVDMTFAISWSDVARTNEAFSAIAEIYGAGIELQRGRDVRTLT